MSEKKVRQMSQNMGRQRTTYKTHLRRLLKLRSCLQANGSLKWVTERMEMTPAMVAMPPTRGTGKGRPRIGPQTR